MTQRVDSGEIEGIVGIKRDLTQHWARAVSEEQTVYILHSVECLAFEKDLRDCAFSKALDHGIDEADWSEHEDQPVLVAIRSDRLVPIREA